jgi:hypothetical protein
VTELTPEILAEGERRLAAAKGPGGTRGPWMKQDMLKQWLYQHATVLIATAEQLRATEIEARKIDAERRLREEQARRWKRRADKAEAEVTRLLGELRRVGSFGNTDELVSP